MLAWQRAKDSFRNPWLHAGMALLFPPLCLIVYFLPRLPGPILAAWLKENGYPEPVMRELQNILADAESAVTTPQSRHN